LFAGGVEAYTAVDQQGLHDIAGAAHHGADVGFEFAQVEGFGQVMVGAAVEADDLVVLRVAGGKDDHRGPVVALAQFAQDGNAVLFRQAEVKDTGIVAVVGQGAQRHFAVPDPVDGIAGQHQTGAYAVAEELVVFNQQDSQLFAMPRQFASTRPGSPGAAPGPPVRVPDGALP
jgi:hypothetical protein